jgi:hypothetical protein
MYQTITQDSPLISVIMPAYNAAAYIGGAIASVLAQTYPHWQLIVIDDGSTDHTAEVVKHLAASDSRITYQYQQNARQAHARNNGIAHAKGSLLALLDADDTWKPEKLQVQLQELQQENADLVFGPYDVLDEAGLVVKTVVRSRKMFEGNEGLLAFLEGNMIMTSSVLMRKASFEAAGGFAADKSPVEDLHLWLKMLLKGMKLLRTDKPLSGYRRHATQSSAADLHLSRQALAVIHELQFEGAVAHALRTKIYPGWYTKLLWVNKGCNAATLDGLLQACKADCGNGHWLKAALLLNNLGATGAAHALAATFLQRQWKQG